MVSRPHEKIEERLSKKYGAKVLIEKDSVIFRFKDVQQLNEILEKMNALDEEY